MIGEAIRTQVFRDTKEFYRDYPRDVVARQLLRFARKHAGRTILDLGCATGNYSAHLVKSGYEVKGADVNPDYVLIARERGVDAYLIEGNLPFRDGEFDTVLLFEVLEHVADPVNVAKEARRVARKNVLCTTPNSRDVAGLQREGLLFEHFADLDHKNFFEEDSLRRLLQPFFSLVEVREGDGINPLALIGNRPVRLAGKVLTRLSILRPRYYFRLFAVATV
jgi:SAM-dependent methyltransferase